jgi:membrane protein implicated in regulation of membrane protease activity
MDLWRKLGISIVFGVAAIIGSGLVWHLAGNWQVVFGYLALLGFALLAFLVNPERIVNEITKEDDVAR